MKVDGNKQHAPGGSRINILNAELGTHCACFALRLSYRDGLDPVNILEYFCVVVQRGRMFAQKQTLEDAAQRSTKELGE